MTAAVFRFPKEYTIAWLMKRPTVTPMVTAIIAPPISTPFPSPVIPPACERPDCKMTTQLFIYFRLGVWSPRESDL